MKESGIDWIGQIPEEWEVIKFKYLGDVKQGLTYSPSDIVDKDEGILVLRSGNIQNGILDFNNNVYVKTKVAESILLRKNDILITARNGSSALIGKNAIIDTDIKATFGAFMMVFRANKSLFAKFAFYLMNVSFNFYRTFFTTSTVNQLTAAIFNGIEVPLPSISEQQKIADFLDKKTAQLDKVKSLLEEQIQKLKDYRASLIYEVVTKGLDKTVPMKDSGIDWIGQVPEGWGVKPIKHVVATPVTDGPHETPLLCETGIPFLSAEAVKNGVLDFNYKRGFISLQDHERFKKKISPKKDDIFIVKSGATTGNVGIVNTDEIFDIWSPLALIRCKKSLAVQKYIYYYLISNIFKAQVEFNWSFGTQQNIGMGIIENIKLILPPLSEQTKISDLLDKKTYQIDQLIQIKNKQIENINKQRQTLIYDYVTGKRRV